MWHRTAIASGALAAVTLLSVGCGGHQRYRRIIVLRKRDVPVPPVLIVTRPVLVNPAVTMAGWSGELSAFTSTAAPPHD